MKRKLMVVIGAGASIELGMPSVNDIDNLFSKWAKASYQLAEDDDRTLYCYIRDEVNRHYSLNPKLGLRKKANFEEILYVMLQLSAALDDDNYSLPTNAFWEVKKLPKIKANGVDKSVEGNDLRQLCSKLIDNLADEFRGRCKIAKEKNEDNFNIFQGFIKQLSSDYDVAFITLNYDNLITQAMPNLFTGFNDEGTFVPANIFERSDWGLIYHLHGSVHFDMQGGELDMHEIKWNANLHSSFEANSFGRNYQDTTEGISMPTSVIVAGYGKTSQIQRLPFRTYYSEIDEIAGKANAFLFLGYGFNDTHLNNSLHTIRAGNGKKSVVVVDWASDNQDPMQFRHDQWSYNICKTIPVNSREMATRQYRYAAPDIGDLKARGEFEVSRNPEYPLSIWYRGFIDACKNYSAIKSELEADN